MSVSRLSTTYELLTSIRFDNALLNSEWNNNANVPSPFLFLSFHTDRLRDAALRHGWLNVMSLITNDKIKDVCQTAIQQITYNVSENIHKICKIRVTLTESGELRASASPIGPSTGNTDDLFAAIHLPFPLRDKTDNAHTVYELWVDSQPTDISIYTTTKTTQRSIYNTARQRAGLSADYFIPADVLMYNTAGELTETSIFNIAVRRSSIWVTPATDSGCLPGVMRRWLLEQGDIREPMGDKPMKATLKIGELVLLFNAVRGCLLGKISGFY